MNVSITTNNRCELCLNVFADKYVIVIFPNERYVLCSDCSYDFKIGCKCCFYEGVYKSMIDCVEHMHLNFA